MSNTNVSFFFILILNFLFFIKVIQVILKLKKYIFRLALCVKRHDEIMSFKPVPYWNLYLTVNVNGTTLKALSTRGRLFDKNKVEGIKKCLKNLTVAK